MKKIVAFLLLCATLLSLMACSKTSPSDAPVLSSIPQENLQVITIAPVAFQVFPTNNGRGFYIPSSVLYYFDFETEEKMVMCSQSGCKHNNTGCIAYLGGADTFAEYHGKWYTTDSIDDQNIQMTEIDPTDGTRTILCTVSCGDVDFIYLGYCSFAYGNSYLCARTQRILADGSTECGEILYRIDLDTGEYEEITRAADYDTTTVLGASERSVLLYRSSLLGDLLSEAAYKAQFGQDADYLEYSATFLEEHQTIELGIYDLESKNYTMIADEENNDLRSHSNNKYCYENLVIYQLGDDLMLYDLTDNTSRKLLTRENIVNYQLKDGKAIYIVNPGDACRIYYADLETGESTRLENNGLTDVMQFGISCETDEYFIGLFHGEEGKFWIKKTDFFNDDYSNVKRLT